MKSKICSPIIVHVTPFGVIASEECPDDSAIIQKCPTRRRDVVDEWGCYREDVLDECSENYGAAIAAYQRIVEFAKAKWLDGNKAKETSNRGGDF